VIVGFDYWQVISHYPKQFRHLSKMFRANGDQVVVISAIGKDRVGTVAREVSKKGFDLKLHSVYEVVFDDPKQSPELKLAKCQELGVEMFFDDRDDVCRLLNAHGILALRVTRKDNSTYDLGAEIDAASS
jgi:acid phosphatase class B